MWTRASIVVTLVLVLTACGGGQESTPEPISLEYDDRAGVLIVEADTYGGLVPSPSGRHVPELSIYGDGLVVLAEEDEAPRVGIDRSITTGHIDQEDLQELLAFIAEGGFFGLDDQYAPSPALPDMPWRHITVNLLGTTKSVSIYPHDYEDAPAVFWETYHKLVEISPPDSVVFTPSAGTLTATDLGPIEDLPAGQGSQVAPWDTPLVGVVLAEVTEGTHLAGEQYQVVEEFLLRYPRGQLFGSQEGRAYQVLVEADLPWAAGSP
jgi:hypothetical protein